MKCDQEHTQGWKICTFGDGGPYGSLGAKSERLLDLLWPGPSGLRGGLNCQFCVMEESVGILGPFIRGPMLGKNGHIN